MDRFDVLVDLAERWKGTKCCHNLSTNIVLGPMSVVVYLPRDIYFINDLKDRHSNNAVLKRHADFHVIYEEEV